MTTETGFAFLGACFLVIGFATLLLAFRLPGHARQVFTLSRASLTVLGDPTCDDAAKERALKRVAARLAGTFVALLLLGTAALAVPLALVWLADRTGRIDFERVLDLSLDWRFLLGSTLALGLAGMAYVRSRAPAAPAPAAATSDYSAVDQTLHEVAFATRGIQAALSGLEDRWAGGTVAPAHAPLFIAGLPRAGTTLLLELLEATGEFASHTYRAMPFVLLPLSWARYTRRFGTTTAMRERSHGDGMMVNIDSPEALEEMLWMTFWPERYTRPVIHIWQPAPQPRFERFFARHRDKIVHLARRDGDLRPARYMSKNNLNIARVDWIVARIDDAHIVIPFREPYQHASSLLRQHRNFTAIHADDAFARAFMAGVGHFDFGANLKPVNFGRWRTENPDLDPDTLAFWLTYWCEAYAHLLKRRGDRVAMFDFDAMCADPAPALARLAAFAGLADPAALTGQAGRIGAVRPHSVDRAAVPAALQDRVDAVFAALQAARL